MANGEMRRCKQRPFWLITLTNDCMRRPSAPPLPESVSAACSAGSATASRWWHFAAPAVSPFTFPSLSPCVGSGGAGFWRFHLFVFSFVSGFATGRVGFGCSFRSFRSRESWFSSRLWLRRLSIRLFFRSDPKKKTEIVYLLILDFRRYIRCRARQAGGSGSIVFIA